MVKRRAWLLLPLAAALCSAFPAHAAWEFTPLAGARLTWSDNLALRPDGQAEQGWVADVAPGFSLTNKTPRLDFQLLYNYHRYQYGGARPAGTQSHTQEMGSALKARVIEDMLYLDAAAAVRQQAVSPYGPLLAGNDYAATNRNEVRDYRIEPYLVHRFGATAQGVLRYNHNVVSTDNIGMRRSESNSISAQLASGPSFRRFGWDATASRTVLNEQLPAVLNLGREQTTSSKNANLNLRYLASDQLSVGVYGGYDSFDFQGLGGAQSGAAYGANLAWAPSTRTSLEAAAGHRFYGPSYRLALQHRSRGTVWNISYDDAVTTTRSQFLLPQTVDTASLLDRLFSSQISDPLQRAAAVQAYMRLANLPPALATAINYFSNRYALQKQFNASVGWKMARTTTLFSLYQVRREALSIQQLDSALLGNALSTFSDNSKQRGANAIVSYQLGPQTVASLTGTVANTSSLVDARSNRTRSVRAAMVRSFGSKVTASLEVRHVQGAAGLGSQQYTENAVVAALTSKF